MASILIPEGLQELNDILALPDVDPGTDSPSGSAVEHRIFIGPMRESVLAQKIDNQTKRAKLNIGSVFSLNQENIARRDDKSEEVSRILKDNAFKFFLHYGGNANDWNEDEEHDLIPELVHRWKGSEWGQFWERRHQTELQSAVSNKWFGTSFEVGTLLGVGITQSQRHLVQSSPSPLETEVVASETGGDEELARALSTFPATNISHINADDSHPRLTNSGEEGYGIATPTSGTSLIPFDRPGNALNPESSSDVSNLPKLDKIASPRLGSKRLLRAVENSKAKVHYLDEDTIHVPMPLEEVLEGTKTTVDPNTHLAVTFLPDNIKSPTPSEFSLGDIVLRGG